MSASPRSPAPLIRLEGVSRSFSTPRGTFEALREVSLDIRRGELLCLVGPSGCGKSTLLNLIAGLERPDAGRVLVRGEPVRGPGPDRAVMFQTHALFPWRTVEGNVAYPLERAGWSRARRRERVEELLRRVHLSRFARHRVHELSGGMRQRVALARALACDPDVLLMDEPFAALDAQTRDVLLIDLQRLWQRSGKTLVFVTHNIREAVVLGTQVALMATRPGRIERLVGVELPRPRDAEDRAVASLAARVKRHLEAESARVLREELGDECSAPEGRLVRAPGSPLGSGV